MSAIRFGVRATAILSENISLLGFSVALFRKAGEAGRYGKYVSRILDLMVGGDSSVDSLSKREMEVLELIADGPSNKEICERLFLAMDTAKGHTLWLYAKLGVHSRT